jgi:hypothetical protein
MPNRSRNRIAIEKLRVADKINMQAAFKSFSLRTGTSRSGPLWVSLTAVSLVFLTFVGDWITPATVVVGLAYEVPVVFAGLKGTPYLTTAVTLLGVIGLTLGWFMDFAADSFHFSSERIDTFDRFVAARQLAQPSGSAQ